MDNLHTDNEIGADTLRRAVNVDVLDSGKVRRRKGFSPFLAEPGAHSLWSGKSGAFFVSGQTLWRLFANGTKQAIATLAPNSGMGNCWTHVLPRWWRRGGYIAIRRADRVALCKWLPVPHALHIESLPRKGVSLTQFIPIRRKQPRISPAIVGYYVGKVRTVEAPHNATQE